jgi:glycerophosphoryl diester phosphodiesterase
MIPAMPAARSLVVGVEAPAWLWQRPVAHRGLHDADRPENSLAAFEAAAQAGHPIELDVHRTADGAAVVFHDEDLRRMTGRPGRVADTTLAELRALALLGSDEHIPALDDVLARVRGRVPVLVELKSCAPYGPLEQAVCEALRRRPGAYAVQSFDPWSLVWLRRHAPELPRGMLSSDFADEDLPRHHKLVLRHLLLAPHVRPSFVGYDLRALPHWAPTALRGLGVPLLAWTVRTEEDLRRARELVDNVIFEHVRP